MIRHLDKIILQSIHQYNSRFIVSLFTIVFVGHVMIFMHGIFKTYSLSVCMSFPHLACLPMAPAEIQRSQALEAVEGSPPRQAVEDPPAICRKQLKNSWELSRWSQPRPSRAFPSHLLLWPFVTGRADSFSWKGRRKWILI